MGSSWTCHWLFLYSFVYYLVLNVILASEVLRWVIPERLTAELVCTHSITDDFLVSATTIRHIICFEASSPSVIRSLLYTSLQQKGLCSACVGVGGVTVLSVISSVS